MWQTVTLTVQCSLFITSQRRWLDVVSVITSEQSAVSLNNVHCSSDVFVFHYFRILGSLGVCFFKRAKIYGPGMLGPLNGGGGGACALHNLHNLLLCH